MGEDWGCGSEVQLLPSMHEAPSSIFSTTKRKGKSVVALGNSGERTGRERSQWVN